jgi:hypothetical protein
MSEPEDKRGEPQSQADRTLLGVAPPRLDGAGEPLLRSPVFVRAGDSVADVEPPPLPRMALPSRPARSELAGASNASFVVGERPAERALRVARAHPVLWMVAAPALVALCVIGLAVATAPAPVPKPAPVTAVTPAVAAAAPQQAGETPAHLPSLAELEAKPPGSLSAAELIRLAEGKSQQRRQAVQALREKVVQSPAMLAEKDVQSELLQAARDPQTAPQALAALAAAGTPVSTDLLYEAWTGTPAKTDFTELARALLYSPDVRPKASPALSVALDLRAAETCEKFKATLPNALKDGDKRSLHLLAKLVNRRGCGAKKAEDCYACLRDNKDELSATINAVKSRRAPVYPTP